MRASYAFVHRSGLAAIILATLQSRSRLAKFAKGHAGLLFGARGGGVIGSWNLSKANCGAHHEIGLLLAQIVGPLGDAATR